MSICCSEMLIFIGDGETAASLTGCGLPLRHSEPGCNIQGIHSYLKAGLRFNLLARQSSSNPESTLLCQRTLRSSNYFRHLSDPFPCQYCGLQGKGVPAEKTHSSHGENAAFTSPGNRSSREITASKSHGKPSRLKVFSWYASRMHTAPLYMKNMVRGFLDTGKQSRGFKGLFCSQLQYSVCFF